MSGNGKNPNLSRLFIELKIPWLRFSIRLYKEWLYAPHKLNTQIKRACFYTVHKMERGGRSLVVLAQRSVAQTSNKVKSKKITFSFSSKYTRGINEKETWTLIFIFILFQRSPQSRHTKTSGMRSTTMNTVKKNHQANKHFVIFLCKQTCILYR